MKNYFYRVYLENKKINFKLLSYTTIFFLLILNFSLLHKYNIFVGDDGVLASIFSGKYYLEEKFSIMCSEIDFHKLYYYIIGGAYIYYYYFFTFLTDIFSLEYRWINAGSFILFFSSLIFFLLTIKRFSYSLLLSVIFLTLEPFLVLSHSIRHDIFIFFGNSLLIYSLFLKPSNYKLLIELLSLIFITIHPSGAPLILAIIIFYLFKKEFKRIFILLVLSMIILFFNALLKGIANLETLNSILELSSGAHSNSAFFSFSLLLEIKSIFYNLYDYFYNAKYKRHLIELILFFLYASTFFQFNNFSRELKIFSFFPLIYLFGYLMLNYFNISYLKFFYYFFLVYFSFYIFEIKGNNFKIALSFFMGCTLFIFLGVFFVFNFHNPWKLIDKNFNKIQNKISSNSIVSAPYYYSLINPKIANNYLPISQLDEPGKDKCYSKYQKGNKKADYVITDTRHLNNYEGSKRIESYLTNYTMIESIKIGRLGTMNLDKNGKLYLYKLNSF